MATIGTNPWAFTSVDVAGAAITAATGLTLNADGTVTVTTTGALTFNTTGVPPAQWFTVTAATAPAYNGFYKLLIGVSGGTTFTLQPQFNIPAGTAQSGSGFIDQCLWPWMIRAEDISWQGGTAADVLDLRDRSGNVIWNAIAVATGTQNRGKIFWIDGFTPVSIPHGTVLITIN